MRIPRQLQEIGQWSVITKSGDIDKVVYLFQRVLLKDIMDIIYNLG